jgi:hypothetical protein
MGENVARRAPVNTARAIYGQILVTSLVAALSEDPAIAAGYVLLSVIVTMIIFWAAHVYAETLSKSLETRRVVRWHDVRVSAAHEWPLVQAAFPTSIVLALGAVGALSRDTAVGLAIGVGVATLFLGGLAVARASGSSWLASIIGAAISGSLGLVIVGLKALVH